MISEDHSVCTETVLLKSFEPPPHSFIFYFQRLKSSCNLSVREQQLLVRCSCGCTKFFIV